MMIIYFPLLGHGMRVGGFVGIKNQGRQWKVQSGLYGGGSEKVANGRRGKDFTGLTLDFLFYLCCWSACRLPALSAFEVGNGHFLFRFSFRIFFLALADWLQTSNSKRNVLASLFSLVWAKVGLAWFDNQDWFSFGGTDLWWNTPTVTSLIVLEFSQLMSKNFHTLIFRLSPAKFGTEMMEDITWNLTVFAEKRDFDFDF